MSAEEVFRPRHSIEAFIEEWEKLKPKKNPFIEGWIQYLEKSKEKTFSPERKKH